MVYECPCFMNISRHFYATISKLVKFWNFGFYNLHNRLITFLLRGLHKSRVQLMERGIQNTQISDHVVYGCPIITVFSFLFSAVFLVCWVPFFTCNIINAICIKFDLGWYPGDTAFIVTTWLGYVNSCVNPLIYTIFNPEFRKAFKKILRMA